MIADKEYSLHITDLFVVNYSVVGKDLERFHEKTQKVFDKLSNINFFIFQFFFTNYFYLLVYYKKI